MSSGLEAVGDAATGALAASAVEPGHGAPGEAGHGACLNCGTTLTGPYCHACGQHGHLHRTIGGFLHDLLHAVFHFEGKLWATLPLLFFKPGQLTRRYILGERAKFVSPMAMFLFCMFLMFAIVGGLAGTASAPEIPPEDLKRSLTEIRASIARNEAQARTLRDRIADEADRGHDTAALKARLETLESDTRDSRLAQGFLTGGSEGGSFSRLNVETGWHALDHGIQAANANPDLFLYQLQSKAYKYSWLLVPISTLMVWLLYCWKREYKVYDHLVFATFWLVFLSLLIAAGSILGALGLSTGWVVTAIVTLIPFHLYRQLRDAYPGSRTGVIVRTVALLWLGFWSLILYSLILLAMGLMH
jgi:hypothetical protein